MAPLQTNGATTKCNIQKIEAVNIDVIRLFAMCMDSPSARKLPATGQQLVDTAVEVTGQVHKQILMNAYRAWPFNQAGYIRVAVLWSALLGGPAYRDCGTSHHT